MRDTIVATRDVLAEALTQEDPGEVRFRVRTAMQLLDSLEHKLGAVEDAEVFSDLVAENEDLRDRLASVGVTIDDE